MSFFICMIYAGGVIRLWRRGERLEAIAWPCRLGARLAEWAFASPDGRRE